MAPLFTFTSRLWTLARRPEEQLADGRSLDVSGLLKDGKHVDGVRQEFKENAKEEEKSADQHAGESLNYPQMWLVGGSGSAARLRACGRVGCVCAGA